MVEETFYTLRNYIQTHIHSDTNLFSSYVNVEKYLHNETKKTILPDFHYNIIAGASNISK